MEPDTITIALKENVPVEILLKVLERAKEYKPALCPPDVKYGAPGTCFDTAVSNAISRKYKYVEGIAYMHRAKAYALHGWVTDGVHAFDPTWYCLDEDHKRSPYETKYFGIEMPIDLVAEFMMRTQYCGVIANYHRDEATARKCIGG